jgi:hypothetical protein
VKTPGLKPALAPCRWRPAGRLESPERAAALRKEERAKLQERKGRCCVSLCFPQRLDSPVSLLNHKGLNHNGELLASELHRFQPADHIALVGNHLCLPNDGEGHEPHGESADGKHETHMGFGSGNSKYAKQPRHGYQSPSTRAPPSILARAIPRSSVTRNRRATTETQCLRVIYGKQMA